MEEKRNLLSCKWEEAAALRAHGLQLHLLTQSISLWSGVGVIFKLRTASLLKFGAVL